MNRKQELPLRFRSHKVDPDVHRIINHAAKLLLEYNKTKISKIMQPEIENREKVTELFKLSSSQLPKIISQSKNYVTSKKRIKKNDPKIKSHSMLSTKPEENNSLSFLKNFCENCNNESKDNKTYKHFLYKVEITTGRAMTICLNSDVFLIINGDSNKSTNKFFLREHFQSNNYDAIPFLSGNTDLFKIYSSVYIGNIESIIVGINVMEEDQSWYLEAICITDHFTSKMYRFTCRRWLGAQSADRLTEVKLGYIHPYHKYSLSCSNEEIMQSSLNQSIFKRLKSLQRGMSEHDKAFQIDYNFKPAKLEYRSMSADNIKIIESNSFVFFGKSIHSAVKSHDYKRVKELCTFYEALKCSKDNKGYTPMHNAAIYYEDNAESREIIYYFISLNVDPNIKSMEGYSPILLAVINNNIKSVKYFNDVLKVDFAAKDIFNNTALHLATMKGHYEIVEYILSLDGDISLENCFGESPLLIAQKKKDQILINMFCKIEIPIEIENIINDDVEVDKKETNDNEKDFKIETSNNALNYNTKIKKKIKRNSKKSKHSGEINDGDNPNIIFNKRFRIRKKKLKNHLDDKNSSTASSIVDSPRILSTPSTSEDNVVSKINEDVKETEHSTSERNENKKLSRDSLNEIEKIRSSSSFVRRPPIKLNQKQSEGIMKVLLINLFTLK